MIMVNKVVVLN